ncbi:uncharacterized protein BDW43DRAFT_322502 [Aspergillus alliaceus]|uniref:uncharacterized protein n=1 Tax=Petromyces alliaceus TaxID=209559 RepID=UPI0012A65D8E|nr:uncharacterized protein BDW43DRAFT_322502 [Aspergillus alliaceus]KAB8228966.1 hypothetical protein BDW43DRAFT_322502 [Aspergillus alliaceus]
MIKSSPSHNTSSVSHFRATPPSSPSRSPRLLTPPSPTQQQHNTPDSPIQQRRSILITMGSCTWKGKNGFQCTCTSGYSISDLDVTQASCDDCMHPMLLHLNFPIHDVTVPTSPRSRIARPFEIPSYVISRGKLVDELIARVNHYHIVRVNGTPASGKTRYGQATPIHSLTGWDPKISKIGWAAHLEQETGVHGRSWINYRAYLLLDEAQQSYWDHEIWADFFKRIEPGTSPFIILFMSYGSPHRGFSGFGKEEHVQTLMVFAAEQQISLRPAEGVETHSLGLLPWRPVGLLLDEDEAMEVVGCYASIVIRPSIALTPDLKQGFFACSNGHVGLLTSLTRVLQDVPALYELVRNDVAISWAIASNILFRQPLKFFDYIKGYPFTRGLPSSRILQEHYTATVLKAAITCDGIYGSKFETKNEELKQALKGIWRNGWLHAERSDNDIRYIFASQIHRWYCHSLFTAPVPDNNLNFTTPLQLAIDTITHFQPYQLANAPRSMAVGGNLSPLEDQYQKEFYRCLFPILDGHLIMSPEFIIKTGPKGGTIDFLIAGKKKWGLELLREHDRVVEHMRRFETGGQYYSMIQSGEMEQYIVLDFTNTAPKKPHPEYKGKLYHVVFSENYREVDIFDTSDLSVIKSFVLTEHTTPII